MNDDLPPMPTSIDDLAAYALDAHDPADDLAIAAHLDAAPGAARWERTLRDAAGEYAAALSTEVAPPDDLRARVLATARRRRPPAAVRAGATPLDVHRVELSRAILLLRALGPADWERPVDPPEFAGWTVHDVAVHLVANESLLADQLGVPVAGIPETATDNEGRTAAARARHRGRPPAEAVDELEAAAEAVDGAAAAQVAAAVDDDEAFGGLGAVRFGLLVRSFETWTHADDARRAIGRPMVPPPAASLLTMGHVACRLVPRMLDARGARHPGRLVRITFTDLGDAASWDVDLGLLDSARPAGDTAVDVAIAVDALSFCRGVSARLPEGGVAYRAQGDESLARAVIEALPALAML